MTQIYRKRHLAERSFLVFQFPQGNDRYTEMALPLIQNVEVSESQKGNWAIYDLYARNNSLVAFTGARSRNLSIKFIFTLPHIQEYMSKEGLRDYFTPHFKTFYLDKEAQKKIFKEGLTSLKSGTNDGVSQAQIHREYFDKIVGARLKQNSIVDKFSGFVINDILGGNFNPVSNKNRELDKAIGMLILWINLVRASVVNNSMDSRLGPPMIRLNHGIMYNNIPCICENYSIRIIPESGYELATLSPRQVEINMQLLEIRTGNYGKYVPSKFIEGDNVTGWESLITDGTMDPYNGTWPISNFDNVELGSDGRV